MTKIHPEAVALLNKHRGTAFRPGGEHYVENLTATEAISQALFERDALKGAADVVYNRLMPEVETLRAQVAEMREVLASYADDFCEYSRHYNECGRLGEDDCSGCLAMRTLQKAPKDNSND